MNCPVCGTADSRVLETRDNGVQARRRRECACGTRWTTEERIARRSITPVARGQTTLPIGLVSPTGSGGETLAVAKKALGVFSESGSFSVSSPDPPDPSKQIRSEKVNIMSATGAVVPSPFFRALRQFCEIWRNKYGVNYQCTAADRNQLGRLVSGLDHGGLQELPGAFYAYLGDMSPWVAQDQRHSLRYFCTSGGFNKYRVASPVLSAKEARGVEAGRQFINGDGTHARSR